MVPLITFDALFPLTSRMCFKFTERCICPPGSVKRVKARTSQRVSTPVCGSVPVAVFEPESGAGNGPGAGARAVSVVVLGVVPKTLLELDRGEMFIC